MIKWSLRREFHKVAPPVVEYHESLHASWKFMIERGEWGENETTEHLARISEIHNSILGQMNRIGAEKDEKAIALLMRLKHLVYEVRVHQGHKESFEEWLSR